MKNFKSESEILALARDHNLDVIEITHASNDYPTGLGDYGIIGFDRFEDAEKFADEHGLEVHHFQTRDGWHFWHNMGNAYEPYTQDDLLAALGVDYYETGEEQEYDCIRESDLTGQELIAFLKSEIEILEELQKASAEQSVICTRGSYYDTVENTMMQYHEDVHTYAIGVFVPQDKALFS